MILRLFAGQRDLSGLQPLPHGLKVFCREAIKIAAPNGYKTTAVLHEVGQRLTVGEQHPLTHLIGQAHERGKFVPGQRRPIAAKLDLIGPQLPVNRQVSAVHPHVTAGVERERLALRQRHGLERPHLLCLGDLLGGQVGLGKYLEGVATLLVAGQCGNSGFDVGE